MQAWFCLLIAQKYAFFKRYESRILKETAAFISKVFDKNTSTRT